MSPRRMRTGGHRSSAADRLQPNGFSLLEVLVALGLVSIAALALAGELSLTMASNNLAGEQSRAVSLAVQKLEKLKAKPADEVVSETKTAIDEGARCAACRCARRSQGAHLHSAPLDLSP